MVDQCLGVSHYCAPGRRFVCVFRCFSPCCDPGKLIVLCFVFAAIFFSLVFRRDAVVLDTASLTGSFLFTARPRLFPAVVSTSIVVASSGCASLFALLSSSFWASVAPLFLTVDGVIIVPTYTGLSLLVPLPRDGVCMLSASVMFALPLYLTCCVRVLAALVWLRDVTVCWLLLLWRSCTVELFVALVVHIVPVIAARFSCHFVLPMLHAPSRVRSVCPTLCS